METYNDYLQHWGILGMKWGKRNGPPYPLSSSQMNSSERKQNVAKGDDPRIKKLSTENEKLKSQLADKRKAEKLAAKAYKLEKKTLKQIDKDEKEALKENDARKLTRQKAKDLNNAQLQLAIERFRKEQEFNRYKPVNPIAKGANFVKGVIVNAGSMYISNLFNSVAKKASDNLADEIVNGGKRRKKEAEEKAEKAREKAEKERKAEEEREYNVAYQIAYDRAFQNAVDRVPNTGTTAAEINSYNQYVESYVNHMLQSQGFESKYKNGK